METILSLYDLTGAMVQPWVKLGYRAITVDCSHPPGITRDGNLIKIGGDMRSLKWRLMRLENVVFVAAFPPCTDLAVSGARWFERKRKRNPLFQEEAMDLVYIARDIAEHLGCPYMIENPVSRVSTLWRKPDYLFHPYEYAGWYSNEYYTKKTCLWTGGGFVMPDKFYDPEVEVDNRIHWMSPSDDRARVRSATPFGFAKAVFHSNNPISLGGHYD